jgi:LmbE family N-acetylglucosaminyl deacetylase
MARGAMTNDNSARRGTPAEVNPFSHHPGMRADGGLKETADDAVVMHNPTTAFNPQAAGVGEADWSERLNTYGEWQPARGHLLVVAPHPDDEVFGAGGLIHDCVLSGHKVTILSVTDGEGADPLRRDLGAVRRQELRDALRKLSMLHVQIERLGLPDGRVAQHRNRLRNAILSLLDSNTTLVAPYEQDGHPDHGAAGRVCIEIARASRRPGALSDLGLAPGRPASVATLTLGAILAQRGRQARQTPGDRMLRLAIAADRRRARSPATCARLFSAPV